MGPLDDEARLLALVQSVAVGLELRGSRVRMVSAFPHEGGAVNLIDWARFSSRERFISYWDQLLDPHMRPYVAATGDGDPLGVVTWLERQRIHPIWPPVFGPDPEDLSFLGLPGAYATAFDLCVTACFRTRSHSVIAELWPELHKLQRSLDRVTTILARLACPDHHRPFPARRLPNPPPDLDGGPPLGDDIPF